MKAHEDFMPCAELEKDLKNFQIALELNDESSIFLMILMRKFVLIDKRSCLSVNY